MDKYIGIDVPAASCTIAVVDARGKQTGSHVVATNGQEIVECSAGGPDAKSRFDANWPGVYDGVSLSTRLDTHRPCLIAALAAGVFPWRQQTADLA